MLSHTEKKMTIACPPTSGAQQLAEFLMLSASLPLFLICVYLFSLARCLL